MPNSQHIENFNQRLGKKKKKKIKKKETVDQLRNNREVCSCSDFRMEKNLEHQAKCKDEQSPLQEESRNTSKRGYIKGK